MTVSSGSTIAASDYNSIRTTISEILTPLTTGYGPDLLESITAVSETVSTQDHWNRLYNDVNKCIKHQTGSDISGLSAPTTDDLITASFVNALAEQASIAVSNKYNVHPSQLATLVDSDVFTQFIWNSTVEYIRNYNWDSIDEAHYHFNLGGKISTVLGYEGTTDPDFRGFVDQANVHFAANPYTRTHWIDSATTQTLSFSLSTDIGVFTSTIIYTKVSTGVQIDSTIVPPSGISGLLIQPVSSSTLYYSYDAISADLPTLVENRKILAANSLSTFTFPAGQYSAPQTLTLSNLGPETVTVTAIESTTYEVSFEVYDSSGAKLISPFAITIPPSSQKNFSVRYGEPINDTRQLGEFNNTITIRSDANKPNLIVNTVQVVGNPEFYFDLTETDPYNPYTYDNWKTEYGLSESDKILGKNIAERYYLSNTDFGLVGSVRRYGLYRRPDAAGLKTWVDWTKANKGGDYTQITANFFGSTLSASDDRRSRNPDKYFDPGSGTGDFSDRSLTNPIVDSSLPRSYSYIIDPKFGSINSTNTNPGYTATLSNQRFNGSSSSEAVAAFSVTTALDPSGTTYIKGPVVTFDPRRVSTIGEYSTDLTVSVTATDLNNTVVTKSKTVTLILNLTALGDANLVKWVSGYETDNAVMGMSYDRIGGKLYLTVGIGSGADGAPTLSENKYQSSYVNVDYLGVDGDLKWTTFNQNSGLPMYKIGSSSFSWGTFMDNYAVWPYNPPFSSPDWGYPQGIMITRSYQFNAPSDGIYTVEFAVDDVGTMSIDNAVIVDMTTATNTNFTSSKNNTVSLTKGTHTVKLTFKNGSQNYSNSNPGGVAATIRDPSNNIVWSTLDTVRVIPPYLYWKEVYRVPIEENITKTYKLGNYLVKDAFAVGNLTKGLTRYGNYFGTPGTLDAGSIMSIDSDGKGNLRFNWLPLTGLGSSPTDTDTATLNGITQLPFYFSFYSTRKVNKSPSGASTSKLIGMTTKDVLLSTVTSPGLGTATVKTSTTILGYAASGASPNIAPGKLYTVNESSYIDVNTYAPISRHWVSSQTNNRVYAGSRSLAFIHPNSSLTSGQIENWGFDYSDVIIGKNIKVTATLASIADNVKVWYGILQEGDQDVNSRPILAGQQLISFVDTGGGGRNFNLSASIPMAVPDPAINQLIYFAVSDPAPNAGFTNLTLNVSYVPYG